MLHRRRRHPWLKTLALILAVLATAGGLTALYVFRLTATLQRETTKTLSEVAQLSVEVLSSQINSDLTTLSSLALFWANIEELTPERIMPILEQESQENNLKRMGFIRSDGTTYLSDAPQGAYDFSDRSYFKQAMQGKRCVSSVLVDRVDGRNILVFAAPVYAGGAISGVLFATRNAEVYQELLSVSTFGGEGYSYVCRSNGEVIILSEHPNSYRGFTNAFVTLATAKGLSQADLDAMRQDMEEGRSGMVSYLWDGTYRYMNYAPIGVNDWYILSVVPESAVAQQSQDFTRLTLLICLGVTLFFALLMLYLTTLQRRSRKALSTLAYLDSVTGLGNVNRLLASGNSLMAGQHRPPMALVVMDVDKFKLINDSYGYDTGDAVLRTLGHILRQALPEGAVCVRTANDNFAMLLSPPGSDREIADLCARLGGEVGGIATPTGIPLLMTVSFGVYRMTGGERDISECLDKANMAKARVKGQITRNVGFYDDDLRQRLIQEHAITLEIDQALSRRDIVVYLQPKIDLATRRTVGAEALVRWQHPERGLIMPDAFIPVLEKNGLITRLDDYVFESVCRLQQRWHKEGRPPLPVSVNLSREHLRVPDFLEDFGRMLRRYDVPAQLMELELTESTLFDEPERLLQLMRRIREMGMRLSMDDFGSGYSSLNLLKDMPMDILKLDRQFLLTENDSRRGRLVVSGIVRMAKDLALEVVAEGVETLEQADFLQGIGCDVAQGFAFDCPIPIPDFEARWVDRPRTVPPSCK